jgi:hypothetical protein
MAWFGSVYGVATEGIPPGGTAGQVLAKIDTTDSHTTWANQRTDWINVLDYGAKNDGTGDQSGAINSAIAACPSGGVVYLPAGIYRTLAPINMVENIALKGALGGRYQQFLSAGHPTAYIKPGLSASFVGTDIIRASEVSGWRIEDITIYGSGSQGTQGTMNSTAGAINGIGAYGQCKGVRLSNVLTVGMSGDGIHTDTTANGWAGGWEVRELYSASNFGYGWNSLNTGSAATFCFSDSKITQSECSVNTSDGWHFDNKVTNLSLHGLWFCWNHGHGLYMAGNNSGNVSMTELASDGNRANGIYLKMSDSAPTAAPAPHVIKINGYIASRDGTNSTQTQGGYAGLRIEGTSTSVLHALVLVDNMQSHVADNDSGTWQFRPDYGIYATNTRAVIVSNSSLTATVAPIFDDSHAVKADPSNNQFNLINYSTGVVTYDAASGAQGDAVRTVFKTADQSVTSSTATQDDTDLQLWMAPTGTYLVRGAVFYDASTVSDIKMGFTGPSGFTLPWTANFLPVAATVTTSGMDAAALVGNTIYPSGAVGVGTKIAVQITGLVTTTGTSGILKLRWAQNTSDATACTVRAGSHLTLTRVA